MDETDTFELRLPYDTAAGMQPPTEQVIRGSLSPEAEAVMRDLGGYDDVHRRHALLWPAAERRWLAEGKPEAAIIVQAEDFA